MALRQVHLFYLVDAPELSKIDHLPSNSNSEWNFFFEVPSITGNPPFNPLYSIRKAYIFVPVFWLPINISSKA